MAKWSPIDDQDKPVLLWPARNGVRGILEPIRLWRIPSRARQAAICFFFLLFFFQPDKTPLQLDRTCFSFLSFQPQTYGTRLMGIDFGQARNSTTWHPEPSFRGTYGLLSSCIVTMALCVWSSIHLNVPGLEMEGTKQSLMPKQTWRKVGWLVLGLFAPEVVTWAAFQQRREAKELHSRMNELLGGDEESSGDSRSPSPDVEVTADILGGQQPQDEQHETDVEAQQPVAKKDDKNQRKRRNQWTMTHSHYAVMGGFAILTKSSRGDFSPNGWKRVTLTALGILHLAEHYPELLPDISVGDINDKSKANGLAKTIIILQASWFSAQCLSRMALGMTVSLLELNTFAHAVCAITAYAMWWNKPFDVGEPTLVDGSGSDLLCASMCMASRLGGEVQVFNCASNKTPTPHILMTVLEDGSDSDSESEQDTPGNSVRYQEQDPIHWTLNFTQPTRTEEDNLRFHVSPPSGLYKVLKSPKTTGQKSSDDMCRPENLSEDFKEAIFRLYNGHSVFGFQISPKGRYSRLYRSANLLFFKVWKRFGDDGPRPFVELSPAHILCCQLASESELGKVKHESVAPRVSNFPGSAGTIFHTDLDTSIYLSLLVAGLAYGGLHLLAWNPPVKTLAETIIWRVAAFCVTAYGCFVSFWPLVKTLLRRHTSDAAKRGWGAWKIIRVVYWVYDNIILGAGLALFYLASMLYFLARIYLVVECFISVPSLPDSVFEQPAWSQYFPHIG
ncbi:hypothetical protein QBC44DRAFT_337640 [Cladorrhinum sp. PSN332]|nr:hypothetical protein QBC44DRAFT_337640 [Cladorrhinum sp. PSN332]